MCTRLASSVNHALPYLKLLRLGSRMLAPNALLVQCRPFFCLLAHTFADYKPGLPYHHEPVLVQVSQAQEPCDCFQRGWDARGLSWNYVRFPSISAPCSNFSWVARFVGRGKKLP